MTAVNAAQGTRPGPGAGSPVCPTQAACTIASLEGELRHRRRTGAAERLLGLLGPGVRLLIIDLSGYHSAMSQGLAVLIGTQRRATGAQYRHPPGRSPPLSPEAAAHRCAWTEGFTICATLARHAPHGVAGAADGDAPAARRRRRGLPGAAGNVIPPPSRVTSPSSGSGFSCERRDLPAAWCSRGPGQQPQGHQRGASMGFGTARGKPRAAGAAAARERGGGPLTAGRGWPRCRLTRSVRSPTGLRPSCWCLRRRERRRCG